MAHQNPWQLSVLLELLDDPRNDIYLLIDGKSELGTDELLYLPSRSGFVTYKNVDFKIYWGGLSQIKGEMFLLERASEQNCYHYMHLISGLDLPIKTQEFIHDFFSELSKECVGFNEQNLGVAKWKTERFHFFVEGFNYRDREVYKYLRNGLVFIQKLLGIKRKREFATYYHGSNWFSISGRFAEYLIERKPQILDSYRYTISCDEVFVQTELKHSAFEPFRGFEGLEDSGNLRLIDWSRRVRNSPYTWRMKDLKYLLSTDFLFARKFDERVDRDIIDAIRTQLTRGN